MPSPALFEPITLRSLTVPNRAWISPMCQYTCDAENAPGVPNDWHLTHLGGFALGGTGLIITEAAGVNAQGRISPQDAGIWNDEQVAGWRRITDFVHEHGTDTKIAIQLAHAGRKASTWAPFLGPDSSVPEGEGGWETVGPTSDAFGEYAAPVAASPEDIEQIIADFGTAAARSVDAGFDAVEIHGAHGYLIHEFLSPLVNTRDDEWGGDDAGRMKLPLAIVDSVRASVPKSMPVLLRISATDWEDVDGDLDFMAEFVRQAAERGVDLVDVSSAGNLPRPNLKPGPGYQTGLAAELKRRVDIPVGTVGMITDAIQAENILRTDQADVVLIARAALADPRWPLRAAETLGYDINWVPQYERVSPSRVY